ncbi:GNAT family N-acetyltransferase [Burkholderia ubonensis]|uniref:GNAT family N-acetyltransferase n=1 Tax=Burkholderia ubonensis TaxID=101571 RepID=UPI002ABD3854|nr:GNAT family N-acetyltransferase [Burkholderia ubonensis]
MDIKLVRVVSASSDALRDVDNIFADLTAYSQRVDGVARRNHAAHEFATALPPGRELRHKYAFLAKVGNVAVGLADIIEDYPSRGTAFIGLLAVRETAQGSGVGRKLFQKVERFARNELEARTMQLAVVEANPVIGFWAKMGFHPTGEVKPFEGETLKSHSILMEKEL